MPSRRSRDVDNTPNLVLPYISPAQTQKHVTHNEAIHALDALVQLAVADRDLAEPPPAPVEVSATSSHPVRAGPGRAGRPRSLPGRTGAAWSVLPGASVNPTPLVDVNATADAANRLAVSAPASLLTHDGAGRQLSAIRNLANQPFDHLAGVLFEPDFNVHRAALVPLAVVTKRALHSAHTNSHIFYLHDDVWAEPGVIDVTDAIRSAAGNL